MSGVEILAQEIIYNTILPQCFTIIGLALIILFIYLTLRCVGLGNWCLIILCSTCIIASFVIFGLACKLNKNSIDHIEYKVIIDDSVSMNEFLDKYEILDQEGKIYTVKERE